MRLSHRVEAVNPALNAVVLMQEEAARRLISDGLPAGPLSGVPFLLKDLGAAAIDFPSHNGSRLLRNTTYRHNSTLYNRLAAAGLVTFGRTTAPESGIGATTEAVVYGGPHPKPVGFIAQLRRVVWRGGMPPLPRVSCQRRMARMAVGLSAFPPLVAGCSATRPAVAACPKAQMLAKAGAAWRLMDLYPAACATVRYCWI